VRLEQVHVPLLLRYPAAIPAGSNFSEAVSTKRIPATVLQMAGLDRSASMPGPALLATDGKVGEYVPNDGPVIAEVKGVRDGSLPGFWPVSAGDLKSMILGNWHYVERSDGRRELYDVSRDRQEEVNLAQMPEAREFVQRLSQTLRAKYRPGAASIRGTLISHAQYAGLERRLKIALAALRRLSQSRARTDASGN
jgi:arylsulfatase A-like enzyme